MKAVTSQPRFTVMLEPKVVRKVQKLAAGEDLSMGKAIAALVSAGLEEQSRKRKFLVKMSRNLADTDPANESRMVDEFRSLILGQ